MRKKEATFAAIASVAFSISRRRVCAAPFLMKEAGARGQTERPNQVLRETKMRKVTCIVAIGMATVACSSETSKPSSTVEGKIDSASFAGGAPTGVDAIDEAGKRTHATINAADGAFRFDVAKGHVYRLVAVTPKGEEPIVFPRTGGRLDKTFRVSSGGARVALGSVHHFDKAPPAGFTPIKPPTTTTAPKSVNGQGAPGECVDGKIMGTGAPCVDDDEKTSCEGGSAVDDHADGECENGKDAKTGLACVDDDGPGDVADAAQPMAIPDKNPPNDVSGCEDGEDDGEENDD